MTTTSRGAPSRHEQIEAEIAQLIVAGDRNAAAAFAVRHYGPEILGYLNNVMGDPDAADDVYSQFIEDVWQGMQRFEPRATLRTWAFKVARNALFRYLRDPYRRRSRRLLTEEQEELVRATRGHYHAQQTSPEEKIARIREQLGPEDREVLVLRLDRELRWSEIAAILQITPETARQRYARIKAKIRQLLAQDSAGT